MLNSSLVERLGRQALSAPHPNSGVSCVFGRGGSSRSIQSRGDPLPNVCKNVRPRKKARTVTDFGNSRSKYWAILVVLTSMYDSIFPNAPSELSCGHVLKNFLRRVLTCSPVPCFMCCDGVLGFSALSRCSDLGSCTKP